MALFADSNTLYQNIKAALPDWSFAENILIIEELNRANAASVFGDIFQLLDREKGTSIYEITAKSEFAHYLHSAVSHKLTDDLY